MTAREELVEQWVKKAEHDLGFAELGHQFKPEYSDLICYHCHQTAEKYLKALLVFLGIVFKKKHDLTYLLDLIAEKIQIDDNLHNCAEILADYAVEIRYPTSWTFPDKNEVEEAFQAAKSVKNFVLEQIR